MTEFSLKVGDTVRLRSSSTVMTVKALSGNDNSVVVLYFNMYGNIMECTVPVYCLKKVATAPLGNDIEDFNEASEIIMIGVIK